MKKFKLLVPIATFVFLSSFLCFSAMALTSELDTTGEAYSDEIDPDSFLPGFEQCLQGCADKYDDDVEECWDAYYGWVGQGDDDGDCWDLYWECKATGGSELECKAYVVECKIQEQIYLDECLFNSALALKGCSMGCYPGITNPEPGGGGSSSSYSGLEPPKDYSSDSSGGSDQCKDKASTDDIIDCCIKKLAKCMERHGVGTVGRGVCNRLFDMCLAGIEQEPFNPLTPPLGQKECDFYVPDDFGTFSAPYDCPTGWKPYFYFKDGSLHIGFSCCW